MGAWLKMLPPWCWALLACLLLLGWQQVRLSNARTELADYRTEVAERDRRAALAALDETKRRQTAVDGVQNDAQEKLNSARADAQRADDALGRLLQRYTALEHRARECGDTITAQLGQAAAASARVRADLLGRLGEAAGRYAAAADDSRVRGAACEAAYDSLRQD